MVEEIERVKHFRQEYRAAVPSQGVPDSSADALVRWAQRVARAMPDTAAGAEEVNRWLGALTESSRMLDG